MKKAAQFSVWHDLTRDPKTGAVIAKDYYRALSFFGGLVYELGLTPAVVLVTKEHIIIPQEPGITMILLAFGLTGAKVLDNYLNRQTADASGNPLAVPPPGDTPPPNMSQQPGSPAPSE